MVLRCSQSISASTSFKIPLAEVTFDKIPHVSLMTDLRSAELTFDTAAYGRLCESTRRNCTKYHNGFVCTF